jgi:hypothetical protein
MINCNLFTTADAQIIAWIVARIETYCRVVVLADRDADLHVGPDKWTPIAQRMITHPEQFVGNYGKDSDPLEIMEDLLMRKTELLKYGRAQRELHPHLKWAR